MKRTYFAAKILLLAMACGAPPSLGAAEGEADEGTIAKPARWPQRGEGTIDLTLQPAEVSAIGVHSNPSFEILYAKPRLGRLPLHLGLAYWGVEKDFSGSGSSYAGPQDNFDDTPDRGNSKIHRHYSLHGAVVRAKLFLSSMFYMNFGLGYRYVRTREVADYDAGGRESRFKEASSVGVTWGIGNRFYIGRWYYIGANWIEAFVPLAVLDGKDAESGSGRAPGYNNQTKTHDGYRMSFRTLVVEIGRLW